MSFSGTKGYQTKPKPGVMLNPLHPLSKGLVGFWLFNEGAGSRACDISGHGNHGTLKNVPPNTQGSGWGGSKFGGGLQFNGINDCVDCGNNNSLGPEALTIEIWLKPSYTIDSSLSGHESPLSKASGSAGYYFSFRDSLGNLACYICNGSSCSSTYSTTATWYANTWYHIVYTYDNTNGKVYVNGNLENTQPISIVLSHAGSLNIGQYSDGSYQFNGSIDSVRIYSHALSAEEIKQLYQDPFCNLLQIPIQRPFSLAIMNQFQTVNLGADLYDGAIIA